MRTEKEKMLDGEMYNPADAQLRKDREHARRQVRIYNETLESEDNKRIKLLKGLFGSTGKTYMLNQILELTMAITYLLAKTFCKL